MSTGSVNAVSSQSQQASTGYDAYRDVGVEDFITLLITQLQNQDPMEPMDNQAMLEQISQIRAIASSEQLTETLESVQMGQNVATAGNLIGKMISGLTDDGDRITGAVDRVTIADGVPKLHVQDSVVSLTNVEEISAGADE